MAAIVLVGSGGVVVSGTGSPIAVNSGSPPELHGDQWGIHSFHLKVRKEERS